MTLEEFTRHLDFHGADLDRWPAELRGMARTLAETAEGRSALEASRALGALLDESLPAPPMLGLKARILAGVPPAALPWPEWLAGGRWRRLAGVAVAPLALGFVLGFAWPNEDDELEDAVSVLAFSSVFDEALADPDGTVESEPMEEQRDAR